MSLEQRKALYQQFENDGRDYYNTMRSQLTLDVEAGNKTLIEIVSIQAQLENVSKNLYTGDWKSALLSAQSLNANDNLTQDYLNTIITDIQNLHNQ